MYVDDAPAPAASTGLSAIEKLVKVLTSDDFDESKLYAFVDWCENGKLPTQMSAETCCTTLINSPGGEGKLAEIIKTAMGGTDALVRKQLESLGGSRIVLDRLFQMVLDDSNELYAVELFVGEGDGERLLMMPPQARLRAIHRGHGPEWPRVRRVDMKDFYTIMLQFSTPEDKERFVLDVGKFENPYLQEPWTIRWHGYQVIAKGFGMEDQSLDDGGQSGGLPELHGLKQKWEEEAGVSIERLRWKISYREDGMKRTGLLMTVNRFEESCNCKM